MNQSSVVLDDQQLLKRSSELDAREAYIAIREKLAEDTEATIARQQRDLELLDSTIVAREVILKGQQAQMAALETDYKHKVKSLDTSTQKAVMTLSGWTAKIVDAKGELQVVKVSIADRGAYYRQQEEVINAQSVDGNTHLKALNFEIIAAKQRVTDLQGKIKSLNLNIYELTTDLDNARASFMPEVEEHEREVAVIDKRKDLITIELGNLEKHYNDRFNEFNSLNTRYKQVEAEIAEKMQVLDTKEREIMTKREALRQEREEMDEVKHYYNSPKSLYDIQ